MHFPDTLTRAFHDLRPKPALKDPQRLLRVAVGMIIATIVGYSTGHIDGLALVCVGAFLAGIAAVMPHNRPRLSAVTLTTLGEIAAAASGIAVHGIWWVILPVLFVGLLTGGLLRAVTIGLSMRVIVVTIIFLAFAEITPSWHTGLIELGLFAAGGLIMVLAQLLPPFEAAFATQRSAIAEVYRALGAAGTYGPAILAADRSLALISHRRRHDVERLTALVELAEDLGQLLQAVRNRGSATDEQQLTAVGDVCRSIADGVQGGYRPRVEQLAFDKSTESDRLAQALTAAANAAVRVATTESPIDLSAADIVRHRPPSSSELIRAELRPSSPMLAHGLRLACAGVVAQLLGMAVGLATPADLVLRGHGFWVVVAVVLILFPDYGETMSRGINRTIGTVGGVVLGIGLSFLPSTLEVHAVVLTVLYLTYLAFRSCGQAYTMFWVVAWISALTVGPAGAITRGVETLIGCALAFVVFLLAPTWHGARLSALLATVLRSESDRLRTIAELTLNPADSVVEATLVRSTARSRIARMEFAEAADRAAGEPTRVSVEWSPGKTTAVGDQVTNIARQTSVLAAFAAGPDPERRGNVRREAEEFSVRLDAIADSVDREDDQSVRGLDPWQARADDTPNLAVEVDSAAQSTATLATLVESLNRD